MNENTIREAKTWLREKAAKDGAKCPVCNRFTKVYKRTITSSMAIFLIKFWNRHKDFEFHQVTKEKDYNFCGDYGKLAYWGLMKPRGDIGESSRYSGYWKITDIGLKFVKNELKLRKYCLVYDNRVIAMKGDEISIKSALTNKFNYEEIFSA